MQIMLLDINPACAVEDQHLIYTTFHEEKKKVATFPFIAMSRKPEIF